MRLSDARLPRTFRSWAVSDGTEEKQWSNPDILPVRDEERTYTWKAYTGYWLAVSTTTTVWAVGSSQLAQGLDAGGAIGGVFAGACLASAVAVLCGEPGILYQLGFPLMSRATFGMFGSFFVITVKLFVNFVFFGIQSYWGGLAFNVMLRAIFPSFQHLPNTLPESAQITTQNLIGYVCYILIFTPLMFIHPSKLQGVVYFTQCYVTVTIVGLFIWALAANGGVTIMPPTTSISSGDRSFLILQAMSSVAGSWTGSAIRQSDWTRFSQRRSYVWWNQMVVGPVGMTVCATMGIAATSAVNEMYGKPVWNPIVLLEEILVRDYSAGARAGTFFAGLGFFSSQVIVNLVQNSVSCGMDLAALWPRYIDVTRGSLIMCLVGYIIQPWRFVEQPGLFISVLNAFGMFVAPLAGINTADFWFVRRKCWKIPDLYKGGRESIYWYTYGWNLRAMAAWFLVLWPSLPGFAAQVSGFEIATAWTRTFKLTWIVGYIGGALVYYLICLVFPPPGKPFVTERLDHSVVMDGHSIEADSETARPDDSLAEKMKASE